MKTKNEPTVFSLCAAPEVASAITVAFSGSAQIVHAAPADGTAVALPRFDMVAYTGGPMRPKVEPPLRYPVVVDLAGLDVSRQNRPALKDHDQKRLVGHTERIATDGRQLVASGVVSGTGPDAREVVDASKNGFTWQVSMGADISNLQFLSHDQSADVNGRRVSGPVYIARSGRIRELSFLTLGADDDTSARIAAEAATGVPMNFEQWLEAKGFKLADMSDQQKTYLQAQYDAERGEPAAPAVTVTAGAPAPRGNDGGDEVAALRNRLSAERQRMADLTTVEAQYAGKVDGATLNTLMASATREGWDKTLLELHCERAARPKAPAAHTPDNALTSRILEAAACLSAGMDVKACEKAFDDKTLQAAHSRYKGRLSLQQMIVEAAVANGYAGGPFAVKSDLRGVLQAAFLQASGFSSVDLSGILGNTANKFLLNGFESVENVWRQITAVRPVNDFKQVTSYRLTGAFQYEKVAPDGQLKHGTADEESFTNQADTYGIMYAITRKDIINDDLGALSVIPRRIGRGAALKINDVFWTAFVAISFTGQHLSASSALGIDGLTNAEQKFMDKTDPDGKPLAIMPKLLLVPTALSAKSAQLMNSTEIRDTTASTKYATNNPHAGKFTPLTSAYLGNASYGNSATAWYLLADPNDVAVIETAFLNGKEQPTVETADADFNTLGIQMRGYHDFGVSAQDVRGGVKATA